MRSKHSSRSPAPQPTIQQLRECFVPDFDAGKLYWRRRPVSHFVSDHAALAFNGKHEGREAIVSAHPAGYRTGRIHFAGEPFCVRRSRILWALHYNEWPTMMIGHRNQDFGDDRVVNLREQTNAQRMAYSRRQAGRSGFRGVLLNEIGGFVANVGCTGRTRYVGTFHTAEEAVVARNDAALALFGEFARLTDAPRLP